MLLRRLRRGEWLVIVALVALVASLFVDWFVFEGADGSGEVYVLRGYGATSAAGNFRLDRGPSWAGLGPPWTVLLVLAGLAMVAAVVQAARAGAGRSTYGALATVVVALPVTFVVLISIAVRTFVATPEAEYRSGGASVAVGADLAAGAWIGLAALLLGLIGLWVALADDRTTARDTATPPAPRDVPSPRPPAA